MSVPPFDEWLAHWFTPDVGAYCWDDDLSACEVTAWLTQLFERPSVLLEGFSPEIINKGLWSICGVETGYLQDMRSCDVPIAAQQRCVRATFQSRSRSSGYTPMARYSSPGRAR